MMRGQRRPALGSSLVRNPLLRTDDADIFEPREVPVNLSAVPVHQFGCLSDTLGFVLEDCLQEFQILLAAEATEVRVRTDVRDWLTFIQGHSLLCGLDAAPRALVETVAFADGDFERLHGLSLLAATYSGQFHEAGDLSSASRLNRSISRSLGGDVGLPAATSRPRPGPPHS